MDARNKSYVMTLGAVGVVLLVVAAIFLGGGGASRVVAPGPAPAVPSPGASAPASTTAPVAAAPAPELVTVPDFAHIWNQTYQMSTNGVDESNRAVKQRADELGLDVTIDVRHAMEDIPSVQTPGPGSRVSKGTSVQLTVNAGDE